MKFVKEMITKIIGKNPVKPLGRWNIDYCNKKINNKIDLSNEDHCGPCGQYRIGKIEDKILENKGISYEKYHNNKENYSTKDI